MALITFGKDKPMAVVMIGRETRDFNPIYRTRTHDS